MANGAALIKLSALDTVVMTANYSIEQGGIWIDGTKLATELKKASGTEGLPEFFDESTSVFIPFSKLEWLMTPNRSTKKDASEKDD
jgi:hypothetical protein